MFYVILFSIPVLAIVWSVWAHRTLRHFRRPRLWQTLVLAFTLLMLFGYAWIVGRRAELWDPKPPLVLITPAYIWTMVAFPGCLMLATPLVLAERLAQLWRRARREKPPHQASTTEAAEPARSAGELISPARRAFLGSLIAAPAACTIIGSAKATADMDSFRVRRFDVAFPTLPKDLDGVTIAHLADIHVGYFTSEKMLRRVSDVTNSLKPDIVLGSGDLIDHANADATAGAATLNRTSAPYGVYQCEGNHDLFESRAGFAAAMKAAGLPLLQNDTRLITIRGVPVELLGLCWGEGDQPDTGAELAWNASRLFGGKRRGAFSILLAHHPHAFDYARDAGVDLTLSGHTHGGQLNPLPGVSPVGLFYKYLSGLYSIGRHRLVVSNGIGNWFPLRVNAPAEIVHITLRRA